MAHKIYKYILPIQVEQETKLPVDFNLLKVAEQQHGYLTLWCLVDEAKVNCHVRVRIYGTGHEVSPNTLVDFVFVDTVLTQSGYVWHLFIEKKYKDQIKK